MTLAEKREAILKKVTEIYDILDPSGDNSRRFAKVVESMDNRTFSDMMLAMKEGRWVLTLEVPNMLKVLKMEDIYKAANKLGVKLFQRLRMTDPATGQQIVTTEAYPILRLPIRRVQQTIDKKMALPSGDRMIDAMTGQVTGPDQASAVAKEELQILYTRGLDEVLKEFAIIRGGSPALYADFKHQLEETGSAEVDADGTARTRVAVMTDTLLKGMHLNSNIGA